MFISIELAGYYAVYSQSHLIAITYCIIRAAFWRVCPVQLYRRSIREHNGRLARKLQCLGKLQIQRFVQMNKPINLMVHLGIFIKTRSAITYNIS